MGTYDVFLIQDLLCLHPDIMLIAKRPVCAVLYSMNYIQETTNLKGTAYAYTCCKISHTPVIFDRLVQICKRTQLVLQLLKKPYQSCPWLARWAAF